MLVVLSPAKSLDFESPVRTRKHSQPEFLEQSRALITTLRDLSPQDLSELMHISPALGELNHARFNNWHLPFDRHNARQALFAFRGDVYLGLKAEELSTKDLDYAQKHLRILSGLYGVLRPLDLMQPYRLEMGTRLRGKGIHTAQHDDKANGEFSDLYDFWGEQITEALRRDLAAQRGRVLINLASQEYFRSVRPRLLEADVVTPVFKDYKNGKYKIISFYAKKARGLMAAYIIRERLKTPVELARFDAEGYRYDPEESTDRSPVFRRREIP